MTDDSQKLKNLIGELAQQDSENDTTYVDVVRSAITAVNFMQSIDPVSREVYTTRLSESLSDPQLYEEVIGVEQLAVLDRFIREAPALVASALFV